MRRCMCLATICKRSCLFLINIRTRSCICLFKLVFAWKNVPNNARNTRIPENVNHNACNRARYKVDTRYK